MSMLPEIVKGQIVHDRSVGVMHNGVQHKRVEVKVDMGKKNAVAYDVDTGELFAIYDWSGFDTAIKYI